MSSSQQPSVFVRSSVGAQQGVTAPTPTATRTQLATAANANAGKGAADGKLSTTVIALIVVAVVVAVAAIVLGVVFGLRTQAPPTTTAKARVVPRPAAAPSTTAGSGLAGGLGGVGSQDVINGPLAGFQSAGVLQ